jgi:hypothetical protein
MDATRAKMRRSGTARRIVCYPVADSIGTYVWALRWKMKLSHQADPVLGVMHWQDFMRVKAHVPHEPCHVYLPLGSIRMRID